MHANTPRTPFKLSTTVNDVGGEELDELHLREPITGDLCDMDQTEGTNAQMIQLISNCAGIQVSEVKKLPLKDTMPMVEWLNGFLSDGAAPGETSSG